MSAKSVNMLIPMAGAGRLFQEAGHVFPKPLVEVMGKPMVQVVCEDLVCGLDQRFIFVIRKEDDDRFALREVLRLLAPDCEVIAAQSDTAGAACTALLAVEHINNDTPLVIANADQYVSGQFARFISDAVGAGVDGSIMCFESIHPKWSFARLDDTGHVVETAEKRPISRNATVGIYYFRQGSIFVDACRRMIRKGMMVMDQYFICPCYNEMILDGMKISAFQMPNDSMFAFSSPDDVKEFERMRAFKVGGAGA